MHKPSNWKVTWRYSLLIKTHYWNPWSVLIFSSYCIIFLSNGCISHLVVILGFYGGWEYLALFLFTVRAPSDKHRIFQEWLVTINLLKFSSPIASNCNKPEEKIIVPKLNLSTSSAINFEFYGRNQLSLSFSCKDNPINKVFVRTIM